MNRNRFEEIVAKFGSLRIGIVGDFCLDRYLEIDPARNEVSIETGLAVYNVVSVRSQPGAAGTILNNLVSLGIGELTPVGFCGKDGEGHELLASLRRMGVRLDHVVRTSRRRTFTYCKPLILEPGKAPRELNRFDTKNWTPTPKPVQRALRKALSKVSGVSDGIIIMDQVDVPDTGVVTASLLETVRAEASQRPGLIMVGDSRRSLKDWPPVCLKMNQAELQRLTGRHSRHIEDLKRDALDLAQLRGKPSFVTLAGLGIVGAQPDGHVEHVPAHPIRGEIDVVGAGDAVTANLTASLAAGATLGEALELAMAAASIVIHKLGTTGTASIDEIRELLFSK
jgi:rfaE bifunctional protein kinase chain/domain